MNNQDKNTRQSPWLAQARREINDAKPLFQEKDEQGNPITLEWISIDPTSTQLTDTIKKVSPLLIETYIKQELEFARKKPEEIPTDWMLKPLTPLFEQGIDKVNWAEVEQQLRATMHAMFNMTDWSQSSGKDDIHIFVFAKDQHGSIVGIIQFFITPEFGYGTVKAALFGVAQPYVSQGIEKLLMSSIFAIVPDVTRIFLHTRITNESAISMYKNWGFTSFAGPLPTWIDLEYISANASTLQDLAKTLH